MVSFRGLLSLAVVLMLALPAVATADPGITVQSVSTDKASYAPGDTVQFSAAINNSLGGWQLAQGHCTANGFPVCLSISTAPSFFSDGQSADFPPGLSTWTWSATAPTAPGTYTFTVQAWDGFSGNFGTQTASFTVAQQSAPSGPTMVYPVNGQTLNCAGAYLLKVNPVAGASGYLYGFFQDGTMVWENYRDEGHLSGTEYAIQPDTPAHAAFSAGPVQVWIRAYVNNQWTAATIITINLTGSCSQPSTGGETPGGAGTPGGSGPSQPPWFCLGGVSHQPCPQPSTSQPSQSEEDRIAQEIFGGTCATQVAKAIVTGASEGIADLVASQELRQLGERLQQARRAKSNRTEKILTVLLDFEKWGLDEIPVVGSLADVVVVCAQWNVAHGVEATRWWHDFARTVVGEAVPMWIGWMKTSLEEVLRTQRENFQMWLGSSRQGTETVSVYRAQDGGNARAAASARKLLGTARATFGRPGRTATTFRLTRAGRRLFNAHRRMRVQIAVSFRGPRGRQRVVVLRTMTLMR